MLVRPPWAADELFHQRPSRTPTIQFEAHILYNKPRAPASDTSKKESDGPSVGFTPQLQIADCWRIALYTHDGARNCLGYKSLVLSYKFQRFNKYERVFGPGLQGRQSSRLGATAVVSAKTNPRTETSLGIHGWVCSFCSW